MKELIVYGASLPNAYHNSLKVLYNYGDYTDCADWNQKQKELSLTIVVEEPLKEPMISKLFIGGPKELEQYRQEMLDGILDFEVERGNWDYTYHDRFVNYSNFFFNIEIDFVINELKRNPSSRRAVILVRNPSVDAFSNDPACLQHIQYFIRDNKLECKVLFRSNDACKAIYMNAFALIMLQKRIADELGVEMGQYVHKANSFHCYEKDFSLLEGYTDRIIGCQNPDDLCFDYVDGWDEEMEEAKERIAEQVEELKSH